MKRKLSDTASTSSQSIGTVCRTKTVPYEEEKLLTSLGQSTSLLKPLGLYGAQKP